jgi:hypothetical protein
MTEDMSFTIGQRVRIKEGYDSSGNEGVIIASPVYVDGWMWVGVLWNGEEYPDWFKMPGLELLQ